MSRDFKNFKPDPKCKQTVEDTVKNYSGKSESELMSDIVAKYTEGVSNGTISKKELDEFTEKAKAYLNQEQLAKLRTIVSRLKNLK